MITQVVQIVLSIKVIHVLKMNMEIFVHLFAAMDLQIVQRFVMVEKDALMIVKQKKDMIVV